MQTALSQTFLYYLKFNFSGATDFLFDIFFNVAGDMEKAEKSDKPSVCVYLVELSCSGVNTYYHRQCV